MYVLYIPIAPSFNSRAILEQISSNASENAITVFVPQIEDSDSPIRYLVFIVY